MRSTFAKDVYSTLLTTEDFILSDGWIGMGSNPNASERIGVDSIFSELAASLLMNIDATSLPVMDFTTNYNRVGMVFHFNSRDSIGMNVTLFEISLTISEFKVKSTLKYKPHSKVKIPTSRPS